MSVTVEIFTQGEEIITGQVVDSNSAWLSGQLVDVGFRVTRHTTVGDHLCDLIGLLLEIAQRADCCICTGGLGPTSDDLTSEAVAQAFGLPLVFDPVAYEDIQAYFERRNRIMPSSNRKQAMFPEGAKRIDNAWGTAPGFALQQGRCWFAFVPGVPTEMRGLFNAFIKPYLLKQYSVQPSQLVTLKTIGIGESALQELIADIPLPDSVQLGFRAGTDAVQTKLLFPPAFPEVAQSSLVALFADKIGDFVFAIEHQKEAPVDLVGVIATLMTENQKTLAVIETVSQGLIAAKCVGQTWLLQSCYQQSLGRLADQFGLDIDANDLMAPALQLATLLQHQTGADFALVQLAVLDTTRSNDTTDQPVSLYTVLATATFSIPQIFTVGGSLQRKQNQAALLALDLLRRYLQNKQTVSSHQYA